jgi:hypothetical protein
MTGSKRQGQGGLRDALECYGMNIATSGPRFRVRQAGYLKRRHDSGPGMVHQARINAFISGFLGSTEPAWRPFVSISEIWGSPWATARSASQRRRCLTIPTRCDSSREGRSSIGPFREEASDRRPDSDQGTRNRVASPETALGIRFSPLTKPPSPMRTGRAGDPAQRGIEPGPLIICARGQIRTVPSRDVFPTRRAAPAAHPVGEGGGLTPAASHANL